MKMKRLPTVRAALLAVPERNEDPWLVEELWMREAVGIIQPLPMPDRPEPHPLHRASRRAQLRSVAARSHHQTAGPGAQHRGQADPLSPRNSPKPPRRNASSRSWPKPRRPSRNASCAMPRACVQATSAMHWPTSWLPGASSAHPTATASAPYERFPLPAPIGSLGNGNGKHAHQILFLLLDHRNDEAIPTEPPSLARPKWRAARRSGAGVHPYGEPEILSPRRRIPA